MDNHQLSVKSYPLYKDSAIAWLGDLPEHWEVKRLKDFSVIVRGGSPRPAGDLKFYEGNIPFLKVGDLTSNEELYLSTYTHTIKKAGLTNTRLISKNTLLLTNSGATLGIPKICTFETTFNDGIAAFTHLRNASQIFLFYFLKSQTKWYLNQASFGQGQPNLNIEIISNTFIPYPPISEQESIATYLDTKTAQCDRKIDLLTQKATQYGKLKQSLINETVTRGLDKSVPMKDSSVEWIGDVPEHWEVNKLSQSFEQIGSGTTPKSGDETYYEDGTINWINTGDLNDGILTDCKRKVTIKALRDHSLNIYPIGSIVIAMYGATIGKVSILNINGCTNQACCVLNKSKNLDIKFLFYWFLSKRNFIISLSYGGGQPNISQDTVKSLRVCAPPPEEQKAIADYLDKKTAQIDQIIKTINTQIEKLKELRKTLINDVVTGKIKVIE